MWKLEVSYNDVSTIPAMAFYGLERALWELHLPHNKLTRIPSESLTLLKKLSVLNLAGKSFKKERPAIHSPHTGPVTRYFYSSKKIRGEKLRDKN